MSCLQYIICKYCGELLKCVIGEAMHQSETCTKCFYKEKDKVKKDKRI